MLWSSRAERVGLSKPLNSRYRAVVFGVCHAMIFLALVQYDLNKLTLLPLRILMCALGPCILEVWNMLLFCI